MNRYESIKSRIKRAEPAFEKKRRKMLERDEKEGGREDVIEDENRVRREDEIEALQAIYDGAMDVNRGQVPGMDVVLTFHVCYRLT
jgi:hypothetical protein